jgi:flagellar basal-body rod protein FlgG
VGQFIDIAAVALSRAERSVDYAAHNISNLGTAGFKRKVDFIDTVNSMDDDQSLSQASRVDFTPGHLVVTENPYDISIGGKGFFVVRSSDQTLYTRNGQFHRDDVGRLIDSEGRALQVEGGGDLALKQAGFQITSDGTVMEDGQAIARIGIADFDDKTVLEPISGTMFAAAADLAHVVDAPTLRQGAVEGSNVSTGDEMVKMMDALRRAETGQRLIQVYDDLLGRALSTFGGTSG